MILAESTQSLARLRRPARTYRHRGHAIYFQGEGSALFATPDAADASWSWCPMWPALFARFRVIALDLLDVGDSAKPLYDRSPILGHPSMIEGTLPDLRIPRAHVLAHAAAGAPTPL